jgi:hypothetical protein
VIINIRGTSGSGKSTIVKALLMTRLAVPIYSTLGLKHPEAYRAPNQLHIIGPYNVPTGGCDAVVGRLGIQGCVQLLEKYVTRGDLIFEGLIISSMWGAVGEWLAVRKKDVIIAPISATLKECAEGLDARQEEGRAKGNKTQKIHYDGTLRVIEKAKKEGFRVESLDRHGAVDTILGWLKR